MHCLAVASDEDRLIGRRQSVRHPVDLAARIVLPGANLRVQLEDISLHGACIRLMHPRAFEAARLCWLQFQAFGQIVWRHELRCGIAFSDPLPEEWLDQTVEFGELAVDDASEKYLRLASAWVHGPRRILTRSGSRFASRCVTGSHTQSGN